MTPALPVVFSCLSILCGVLILRAYTFERHPALLTLLGSTAFWVILRALGIPTVEVSFPLQLVFYVWAALETLRYFRVSIPRSTLGLIFGAMLVVTAFAAGLTPFHGSQSQQLALRLWRSYFLVLLCLGYFSALIYRWAKPPARPKRRVIEVAQCRRHQLYRYAFGAWLLVIALAGTFVHGGLGYRVLPFSSDTAEVIGTWTYIAMLGVVSTVTAALLEWLPRRKVVAQVGDIWLAWRKAA